MIKVRLSSVHKAMMKCPVIQMPAAPFVGLHVRVKWLSMDYHPIDEIHWDDKRGEYIAYFKED